MAGEMSKILIIGGTGYLDQYMVKASVSLGHSTYAYVRPIKPTSTDSSKLQLHNEFEAIGLTLFQGELDDHEKLVGAFKQVDIVISTLAVPQHLEQLKIIKAIKEAGNIKRFIPSEFGNEEDRASGLPPFEAMLVNKRKIRRATEAAGISYTFVSANSFASYFVDYLLHPHENRDEVIVYGSGEAKAVFNYEKDVAAYTIRAATDPRAANRILICRPQGNIISQLELISAWEEKTGRTLKRIHVPEQEIIELSKTLPHPDNGRASILHNILIKGEQMNFELTDNDLEASKLYLDHKYTSIDSFLDICLVDPSKIKLASL
uniref:LOW QUALITY PROTEIN: isoeugenol synthase 1-like n=1 Tax=Fragaria vesca subsp. vesca TaxID=101020 RepID=UPI0005CB0793|nr:PREDICTED: LOW QUALITY PROTEIN: isoeugenol synthase 1-like [Fragaria vesca subsp. vesca]